jgi:flagellar biosynthesis/type III secretory pathway chaperone
MPSLSATKQFLEALEQTSAQLRGLYDALQREKTALRDQDLDQLGELARQKEAFTTSINAAEQQRIQALQADGTAGRPQEMDAFVAELTGTERRRAHTLWDAIMALAADCERLNKLNGIVLANQQRRAQTLLAILRNETAASDVYAANGNREGQQNSHSLARA